MLTCAVPYGFLLSRLVERSAPRKIIRLELSGSVSGERLAALFTFVIPVAFITTVPAQAVVGRNDPQTALVALAVALALLPASRWLWRFAIRSYTSTSS